MEGQHTEKNPGPLVSALDDNSKMSIFYVNDGGLGYLLEVLNMKHFGIWCVEPASWMQDVNGMIFWTSSKVVAEAQLSKSKRAFGMHPFEVREFIDETEGQKQP